MSLGKKRAVIFGVVDVNFKTAILVSIEAVSDVGEID